MNFIGRGILSAMALCAPLITFSESPGLARDTATAQPVLPAMLVHQTATAPPEAKTFETGEFQIAVPTNWTIEANHAGKSAPIVTLRHISGSVTMSLYASRRPNTTLKTLALDEWRARGEVVGGATIDQIGGRWCYMLGYLSQNNPKEMGSVYGLFVGNRYYRLVSRQITGTPESVDAAGDAWKIKRWWRWKAPLFTTRHGADLCSEIAEAQAEALANLASIQSLEVLSNRDRPQNISALMEPFEQAARVEQREDIEARFHPYFEAAGCLSR